MKVETLKFEPGVGLLLEGGRCDAYMAALSRTVDLAVSAQKPRLCAQGCMLLRSMPTSPAVTFSNAFLARRLFLVHYWWSSVYTFVCSNSVRRRDIPFRRHHYIIFRIILSCRARRS
jgi:hypothetical protein